MSDKEKILIADDSAMNRAILTEMLGDGYEILEAENGRQAVAILQSATDIDLLLLDIMMPEMDGFEVLAMMNKYHWIDEVPVIMISAENASSVPMIWALPTISAARLTWPLCAAASSIP